MRLPCSHLLLPDIPQHQYLDLPSFSFLIDHPRSQRKILFDLGLRKEFSSHPPAVGKFLRESGWDLQVTKDIPEILKEGNLSPTDIEAVIFSHHHFDHVGDLSQFPPTTEVVVGPGFKNAYLPGWPVNPESSLIEDEWKKHKIREVLFNDGPESVSIGGFQAVDYFGDRSFFLLNAPGHTIGHLAALARISLASTSSEEHPRDKFVFLGGDICHYPGAFRPTKDLLLDSEALAALYSCPASFFLDVHPEKNCDNPFYKMPGHCTVDEKAAERSIQKMGAFDANEDVLVIIGHDASLIGRVEFFPKPISAWERDGKASLQWAFLKDFCQNSTGK
ncbi:Cytochrome P450 monooxygenase andK [Penicillium rolfsii]|nr:Cytochrome P450 monooxygenase andK [Penicillium rolfsii]